MTGTPLFHETARQLWVNGQLSRETQTRLMMTPIRMRDISTLTSNSRTFQQVGCDYIIPSNPANLERNREIIRIAMAEGRVIVDGDYIEGLNARLDWLG